MIRSAWLITVALLLVIGLSARLYRLELMLFDFDEGVASIYALQLVAHGDFPLVGVRTSLGFYNPPAFIYLVAPAFLVSKSPLVAVGMLQVFYIACVGWLAFAFLRRGWTWGVIAALLLACLNPGSLFLANRLWGHALIPTFSIAAFLLLMRCVDKRTSTWPWLLLPIVIALAQQVHFSGALLLVDCMLAIIILRVRPQWKFLIMGTALAALLFTPFLVHELRTGFADLRAIVSTVSGQAGAPDHHAFWRAAFHSLSDFGGATAFQENYSSFLSGLPVFIVAKYFLMACGAAAMLFGFSVIAKTCVNSQLPSNHFVICVLSLVWILVPLLVFSLLHVITVPAYWLIVLPAPWLLAGIGSEALATRYRSARFAIAAISVVIGMTFLQYIYIHQRQVAIADPTMLKYPSYRDQRDAVSFVCSDSHGRPAQLEQSNGANAVDYQVLYLIAMIEGNATRLRHDPETAKGLQRYILHRRTRPASFPGSDARQFGLLEVYVKPLNHLTSGSLSSSQTN